VFFDVRNNSGALSSCYEISLNGIQDVRLIELATQSFSKVFINGLSKCTERDAPRTNRERIKLIETKNKGLELIAPERGNPWRGLAQISYLSVN
jgi:exonuclease 3'-5' domain-containing protein 1